LFLRLIKHWLTNLTMMNIKYLTNNTIDKKKWDDCITNASNGLIYAYSYYLDAMAKNWDALILNDYEAVMPLTWNKKYGFYYIYQPFFTASLGIFGKDISADLLNKFLTAIPEKFKYWDFYLSNYFSVSHFELYKRTNYILPLNKNYELLFASFRDSTKRNIKKAEQLGCIVKKEISIEEIIMLAAEQSNKFSPVTDEDYEKIMQLYKLLHNQQKAITYGAYSHNNELLASCAFFFSHERAYYILVGNHPNGKTIGASHLLINAFIKDHAGENLLLDFEGSEINNVAFFYSSFGATEEKYMGIKLNKLPKLIRLLKK